MKKMLVLLMLVICGNAYSDVNITAGKIEGMPNDNFFHSVGQWNRFNITSTTRVGYGGTSAEDVSGNCVVESGKGVSQLILAGLNGQQVSSLVGEAIKLPGKVENLWVKIFSDSSYDGGPITAKCLFNMESNGKMYTYSTLSIAIDGMETKNTCELTIPANISIPDIPSQYITSASPGSKLSDFSVQTTPKVECKNDGGYKFKFRTNKVTAGCMDTGNNSIALCVDVNDQEIDMSAADVSVEGSSLPQILTFTPKVSSNSPEIGIFNAILNLSIEVN